ncbi:RusA family crossover junction endodeoxyribonuclease [Allorhizobium pseudoryzae]|jgi:hypothetical protein|uniref:RusA family crossover junction endodeoxyribonuclease n=1 Tax=Allorhizobium pseudoryzae TaxID=379684 RepID=UPI003D064A74
MWPDLPLEFIIEGTAISQQGSAQAKETWKTTIRHAARRALPEGSWLITDPLAVTIFLFPRTEMQGDIDNRVKPILDAMIACVYSDDALVERIVVQKFEPQRLFAFHDPSTVLAEALDASSPVVYIRVTDNLHEDLATWVA